jgi:uncharacterized damage-inducible protein DinB
MELEKGWFVALAEKLGPERSLEELGEDEWSLVQVMDHLVLSERAFAVGILRASQPIGERTLEQDHAREAVLQGLLSGGKYPVPVAAVEPAARPEIEAVLADWAKVRERLGDKIASGSLPADDLLAGVHPIAGPLNARDCLQFLLNHLIYHRIRVAELLAEV